MSNYISYRAVACNVMVSMFRDICLFAFISLVKVVLTICKQLRHWLEQCQWQAMFVNMELGLFWKLILQVFFFNIFVTHIFLYYFSIWIISMTNLIILRACITLEKGYKDFSSHINFIQNSQNEIRNFSFHRKYM